MMTKLIVNGKTISKSEKDCPLKLVVREGETATVELSVSSEDIEKALVRAYDAKTNKSKYPDFALTRDMRKEIEKLLQAPVKEEKEMIDQIIKEYTDDCRQKICWLPELLKEKLLAYSKAEKIKLLDRLLSNEECCENCGNGIANVPSEYIQDELKRLKELKGE